MRQEPCGIIAADAQSGLRQVVRAKAEEAADFGDFIGH